MKRALLPLIFFLAFVSQSLAIGEWELFNSNGQYRQMTAFDGRLYTICGTSVFWADPMTGDNGSINPTDGMHGSDAAFLLTSADYLVIVYRDGLVDLMTVDGKFHDIPDFQNKIIAGDRTINQAKICGQELFLACAFGVVEMDLETMDIRYSFSTPSSCQVAFSYGDYLYYSSDKSGLKRCNKKSNYLIESQWETIVKESIIDAVVFSDPEGENHCWITSQGSEIQEIDTLGNIRRLNLWNNRKMYPTGPYVFCSGWGLQIVRIKDLKQCDFHSGPFNGCNGYYADGDSVFFALNNNLGIQAYSLDFRPASEGSFSIIDDQFSHDLNHQEWLGVKCTDLEIDQDGSLVAINGEKIYAGGYTKMTLSNSIINTLKGGEWSYILEDSVISWLRDMSDDPSSIANDYYRGLTDLVIHPSQEEHYYVGSLTHGLYEFDHGVLIRQYDAINTPNGPVHTSDSEKYTRLTALAFDDDNNLWTGYSFSDCALAVMTANGQWVQHPLSSGNSFSNLGRIIPTTYKSQQLIWMVQNYGYQKCSVSILYNPGGVLDASKDQSVTFHQLVDQDNNVIDLNYIYDICEDHSGNIWILTTNGPFRIEDPIATFNYASENRGRGLVRRVKIPRNDGTNLADYLMVSTPCTCMAIDNYNRKWIGTNGNGLYLLSDDCVTEIEHFSVSNSLLPSDEIVALAYDGEANTLYISTGSGLAAYHTDDLAGEENYDNMYCFPNPVRPEYSGDLRIMGLADNSTVSVTDTSGNLIVRIQSIGSTAVWDLRQNDGERVSPGIYMIHGISADLNDGKVIKVLVL